MNRARSSVSDTGDDGGEEMAAEAEYTRLQRNYRVMSNDCRTYKETTKRFINGQKSQIKALETEKVEVETIVSKMQTAQTRNKDEKNVRTLSKLSTEEKHINEQIQAEHEANKRLNNEILKMERKIAEQRKKMGGIHKSTSKNIVKNKRKGVLENRLDKAMVQFNKQLAINTALRSDIDHLRQERAVFNNLHQRLTKEQETCKAQVSSITENLAQAFEQRDEAQSKIVALRERSEKDQQIHEAEMKDLLRCISHDNKIKEFMNIKASDRAELKLEESNKKKKKDNGEGGANSERALVESYQQIIARIQEVTGERDLDTIVRRFVCTEEENFALFSYVNELNAQTEQIQEEVNALNQDMDAFRAEEAGTENRRTDAMRQLEARHDEVSGEKTAAERRLRDVDKTLDELTDGVASLFRRIGCDPRPILDMLDGDSGIGAHNIMAYMGLIEQRTTQLVNVMHYYRSKRAHLEGTTPAAPAPGIMNPPTPLQININPPNTGDEDDSADDSESEDAHALNEAELRARVLMRLERRRRAPPTAGADQLANSASPNQRQASTPSKRDKKSHASRRTPQH